MTKKHLESQKQQKSNCCKTITISDKYCDDIFVEGKYAKPLKLLQMQNNLILFVNKVN